MPTNPLVSVIIIFLNMERFIAEAIDSVIKQSYGNWELLLVDDGSIDASTEIARRYVRRHTEKITYLEHDGHRNRGMSASRNLGVRRARGDYIGFLDADDAWFSHKLAEEVSILIANPEVGMVVGASEYWRSWTGHADDTDYIVNVGAPNDTIVEHPKLLTLLYPLGRGAAPCPSSLLMRRNVFEAVGGFEEDFRGMYEDQAFLAKAYLRTSTFVSSSCWDRYRLHPDSCVATAARAGSYHSIRQFFLRWLEGYLTEEGVVDAKIWQALRSASWPYRHPILHRLTTLTPAMSRARKLSAVLRNRLLEPVSRWLRAVRRNAS